MSDTTNRPKVLISISMRTIDGREWCYGQKVTALDEAIEMEIRDAIILHFLQIIRESGEVDVV